MNLEQQVCSLELAKKLKELGVKQESYFTWSRDKIVADYQATEVGIHYPFYAAFTVAELGEMFGGKNFAVGIDPDKYWCEWYAAHGPMSQFDPESLANAAAKMLIYLIENKLITV